VESDFSDMMDDEDTPAPTRNPGPLMVKWTPAPNSTCEAVPENYFTPTGLKYEDAEDISMTAPPGPTKKADIGLNISKHAIPKADKAFVEQAVKEAVQEAERIFNEKMKKHLPAEDAEMTEKPSKKVSTPSMISRSQTCGGDPGRKSQRLNSRYELWATRSSMA